MTAAVAPAGDGTPGDPTTARLTFTDATTGEVLCANVSVTATGAASCTFVPSVTATTRTYAISLKVDGRYVGGSTASAPFAVTIVPDAPDDTTAPDTAITAGPGSILLALSTTVAVDSEDGATLACTLDGAAVDCADGSAAVTGLAPGTHVFSAAATDAAGNTDATPATRTFTVPVDDVGLRRAGSGWSRVTGGNAYLRTLTTAQRAGTSLTYAAQDATALLLVARRSPGAGTVRVYLGSRLLRTISLDARSVEHQKVFNLGSASAGSGTVRIETVNRRPVAIDGLVVITNP